MQSDIVEEIRETFKKARIAALECVQFSHQLQRLANDSDGQSDPPRLLLLEWLQQALNEADVITPLFDHLNVTTDRFRSVSNVTFRKNWHHTAQNHAARVVEIVACPGGRPSGIVEHFSDGRVAVSERNLSIAWPAVCAELRKLGEFDHEQFVQLIQDENAKAFDHATPSRNRWVNKDGHFIIQYGREETSVNEKGASQVELLLKQGKVSAFELSGGSKNLAVSKDAKSVGDGEGLTEVGFDVTEFEEKKEGLEKAGKELKRIDSALAKLPPESVLERSELQAERDKLSDYIRQGTGLFGRPRMIDSRQAQRKKSINKNLERLRKSIKSECPQLEQHLRVQIRYDEISDSFQYCEFDSVNWEFD